MYSMRDRDITFGGRSGFKRAITDSEAFRFGRDDIVRIRTQLGTLIDRLSIIYKRWKDANGIVDDEADDDADGRVEVWTDHNQKKTLTTLFDV